MLAHAKFVRELKFLDLSTLQTWLTQDLVIQFSVVQYSVFSGSAFGVSILSTQHLVLNSQFKFPFTLHSSHFTLFRTSSLRAGTPGGEDRQDVAEID